MPPDRAKSESGLTAALHRAAKGAICTPMVRKSPLDDPENAAFAWARYRRIMRFMFLLTVGVVAIALALLYKRGDEDVSIHFYIAVALGIGFTMLLTSALMGLVFLSSGTGHDESIEDPLSDRD